MSTDTLREAIDKVVEHTRTLERRPTLAVDRALSIARGLDVRDVSRVTQDADLRDAYVDVITATHVQIAEALRG